MLVSLVFVGGCGGEPFERQVVAGKVTYNGQKVTGDILFVPVGSVAGPTSGGQIANGEYRVDHNGGVPVGKHQVRIRGFLGDMASAPPSDPNGENPNLPAVPPEFYSASKIEVDIAPGGSQVEQDFALTPGAPW
jgi:hypothetical protein